MKQIFLLTATLLLLVSCTNTPDSEAEMHKKRADSLAAVLATLIDPTSSNTVTPTKHFAAPESGEGSDANTYHLPHNRQIDTIAMSVTDANVIIQNWHRYVKHNLPAKAMKSLSFVLDANVLTSYVMKDSSVTNVIVYVAMKADSSLTLVYVPAKLDPTNSNKLTEMPFLFDGGHTQQVFENIFPCPTCDKIGVHQVSRQGNNN